MKQLVATLVAGAVAGVAVPAHANPHSGVDAALFRPSIDTSGVFSLEGARLMPKHDLSWKLLFGFAQAPFEAPVPGIGGVGNTDDDIVLDYTMTLDIAFGLSLTEKLAVGLGVAAYRTDTGEGYGSRGRFASDGSTASTGLISLRELSNFDPSGGFEPQGLSGPLDARLVAKYALSTGKNLAVSLMGAAAIPFGEDEMFLGDRGFVLEPRVLIDYRLNQVKATKFVFNVGARFRERTVLEAYDPFDPVLNTPEMSTVVADIGSELTAGAGFILELGTSLNLGVEAVGFVPLPGALSFGDCRRADGFTPCSDIEDDDYFAGGGAGDLAAYAMGGFGFRASPHLMINVMGGAGLVGMRGDDFRISGGLTWSPQPKGIAEIGRGDRDGDGIPDVSDACMEDSEDRDGYQDDDGCPDVDNDGDGVVDANDTCPDEPEDRDAYQDEDGCPERDNDGDGITDVADRCPDAKEDLDEFEDDDGCPDEDNDGDGIVDEKDQCPNEAETVNNVDDTDGCPDTRTTTGPIETSTGIDLRGNRIEFVGNSANLTNASKTILGQVASLIQNNGLRVRIEVHVPLGTKSRNARRIRTQRSRDKDLARRRAQEVLDYLQQQGVPIQNLQAVGIGSDRPLSNTVDTDPINERVDFVKTQQRNP